MVNTRIGCSIIAIVKISLAFALLAGALAAQTPSPSPSPAAAKPETGLYANITTSMGPIRLKLYEKETPITVRNFVQLAQGRKAWTDPKTGRKVMRPMFNGLIFHRVLPNFMIQGGDPNGNGTGDGGIAPIADEFLPSLKFDVPGLLAMANRGLMTGTCQFFITEVPTPHLNGKHTIFGHVVSGFPLVGQIARVPADGQGMPRTPVKMVSVVIERVGPVPPNAPEGPAVAPKKAAPAKGVPAAKPAAAPVKKAPAATTAVPKKTVPAKK